MFPILYFAYILLWYILDTLVNHSRSILDKFGFFFQFSKKHHFRAYAPKFAPTEFHLFAASFGWYLHHKEQNYTNSNLNETFGPSCINYIFNFHFSGVLSIDSRWPQTPGVSQQLRYYSSVGRNFYSTSHFGPWPTLALSLLQASAVSRWHQAAESSSNRQPTEADVHRNKTYSFFIIFAVDQNFDRSQRAGVWGDRRLTR